MKKIVVFLFWVFVSIMNIFAECPEGFSRHIIRSTYYCGCEICRVDIAVCCKWDPVMHKLEVFLDEYEYVRWGPCCISMLLDTASLNYFLDTVITNNAEAICLGEYPPCDHPTLNYYEIEIKKPLCIYYKNAFVPPFLGEEPMWLLRVKRCAENALCILKYRVCMDYTKNPPSPVRTLTERYITSWCEPNNCPTTLPPEGKTWEEAWTTECCYRGCQCFRKSGATFQRVPCFLFDIF